MVERESCLNPLIEELSRLQILEQEGLNTFVLQEEIWAAIDEIIDTAKLRVLKKEEVIWQNRGE